MKMRAFVLFTSMMAVFSLDGQTPSEWSMDVHLLSSVAVGRPDPGEGFGWGGQGLTAGDGALFGRWGLKGTRSYGVFIRRQLGKVGQLAFGFEQMRRIWTVETDWIPDLTSGAKASTEMDWIVASYALPILYRTEVTLTPGWRLGAGGGIVMEMLPTNAFSSTSVSGGGDVFAVEHESLRYGWSRWGMALELGVVKEGEDADVHIGGVLRPLIQPLFQGGLTGQWNLGQADAGSGYIERVLDGSWWGADIRVILH